MNRFIRNTGLLLTYFLVTVGIVQFFIGKNDTTEELNYNQIIQVVEAGNATELTMQTQSGTFLITGKYKQKPAGAKSEQFTGRLPLTELRRRSCTIPPLPKEHLYRRQKNAGTKLLADIS